MSSFCKQYFSVAQCGSYRSASVTIHLFPKNEKLRKLWAIALKLGKPVTSGMMVCSLRFEPTDFCPKTSMRKRLLKNVIPTKNIPVGSHDKPTTSLSSSSPSARSKRIKLRKHRKDKMETKKLVDQFIKESANVEVEFPPPSENENEKVQVDTFKIVEEKGVQVDTLFIQPKIDFVAHLLTSNKKFNTFTGVNIKMFESIEKCCINTIKFYQNMSNINLKTKICIVLVKLKLDMSFTSLAVLFSISDTTAKNFFFRTIDLLSVALKPAIYWPTKEEILLSMPNCFAKFNNVRVVIDATEIYIQKSKCLNCRIRSYSHYKKGHTAKYLICVTPAGIISYVSQAYGGRMSAKAIFNKEKIINLMEPFHDGIMVDKGVLIEKECLEHNVELIRPPFLKKKKQLSKSNALLTASIARARVHVERAIQRIKVFKLFKNKLEWALVPFLDQLMIIVCAIVNLSAPILGDQAFPK